MCSCSLPTGLLGSCVSSFGLLGITALNLPTAEIKGWNSSIGVCARPEQGTVMYIVTATMGIRNMIGLLYGRRRRYGHSPNDQVKLRGRLVGRCVAENRN